MAYDGLFINRLVSLIKPKLEGSKISKIGQIDKNTFLLSFYKYQVHNMVISIEPGNGYFYLDDHKVDFSNEYFHFANVLKHHLLDGELISIDTYNNDRILKLEISKFDEAFGYETKYLFIELLGKFTNMILTRSDLKIIDAVSKLNIGEKANQIILPSFGYKPPISKEKLDPYSVNEKVENYVDSYYGISPLINKEIIYRNSLESVINELNNSTTLYVYDLGNKKEFHFIKLEHLNVNYETFEIFDGIKSYYINRVKNNLFKQKTSLISNAIAKRLTKINNSLAKLLKEKEKYQELESLKENGDNLFTYGSLGEVKDNYFIYNDEFTSLKILIDPTISLTNNAKKYFKKYNKIQKAIPYTLTYIENYQNEIKYYENILEQLTFCNDEALEEIKEELASQNILKLNKIQKNKKKRKFNLKSFKLDNGIVIEVGQNNLQNEYLTFEKAKYNEYFFHVQMYAGSHVIVHSTSSLDEKTIRFAANLAAYYSKAKYSSSVPVDYTLVKNVKKHPLNLPGLVLLKNYKTIYIDPNEPN